VIVIAFAANVDLLSVAGSTIAHRLSAFAVTAPAGNVIVILLAEEATIAVDVPKEIVAVLDIPGFLLRVNAVAATAVTAPTA